MLLHILLMQSISNIPRPKYGISLGWRYEVIVFFGSLFITAWIYIRKGYI